PFRSLERRTEGEEEAELLTSARARVRELLDGVERLREIGDRLAHGRTVEGAPAGLGEVRDGFRPHFTAERMCGETLDVLRHAVRVQALDRFDDRRVQNAAPLPEEAPVGDLVRQRVLEGVLERGEEVRL